MIAVISTDPVYHMLEQLNRRSTWNLLRITSTSEKDIARAIEQNDAIDCILIDAEALKGNIDLAVDIADRLSKTTSCRIIVIGYGFEKNCAIEHDFVSIGIPPENIIFAEYETEIKSRLLDLLPKSSNYSLRSQPVTGAAPDDRKELAEAAAVPSKADRAVMKQYQIRKPITKTAKAVTIGVAGAGSRIGTTTQTLQIALYLKALDYSVAIVDLTESHHLHRLGIEHGGAAIDDSHIRLRGLDLYSSSRAILEARQKYHYAIFDYGDFQSMPDVVSYLEKDVKVLCCGYKPWEADILIEHVFDLDDGSIDYLFFAVPQSQERDITEQMADAGSRTYFAPWTPDPLQYCGDDATYRQILSGKILSMEKTACKSDFLHFFNKRKK